MPNWCKGVLKVRGTKDNILNFLQNGLQAVDICGDAAGKHTVEVDEYDEITIDNVEGCLWVKNTRRNFIEDICDDLYLSQYSSDTFVCAIEGFKAAWGIDAEDLAVISKEYGIDFKIYAFETGMQFNQDIEVIDGEVIKNDTIKFDNYEWECIDPFIGG